MARKLLLLCLACIFMLLSPTIASASTTPPERLYDRQYSALFDSKKFWISSSTIGQFNKGDDFDLGFENGTLWLKYWYTSEQYRNPDWSFQITFVELMELYDDGDQVLDASDIILSGVNLTGDFYTLSHPIEQFGIRNGSKHELTAYHSSGKFQLTFKMTTEPDNYTSTVDLPLPSQDGQLLQMPTEVVVKPSFLGFGGNETNRSIALLMNTSVSEGYSVLYQEHLGYRELNVTNGTEGGYFRWSTTALGLTPHGVVDTWDPSNLTLMYPADDPLDHGLVIGVNSIAPLSGLAETPDYLTDAKAYGVGIFVAIGIIAAAIIATIILRKRALKMEQEVIER